MQRILIALLLAAPCSSQPVGAAGAPAGTEAGAPTVSSRGAPSPLTLADAVRLAKANNPGLAAGRLAHDVAAGAADEARRWPNPELEFSAEDIPAGQGGLSAAQNMIGVSQTIPFPGKQRLAEAIGREAVALADHEVEGRERELVRDVKVAFCRALAAEKRAAVSEELQALALSLSDGARKRVAAGEAGRQESVRAELEVERARVALADAHRELTEARQALAALMGSRGDALGALQGTLRERAADVDLEALRAQMLAQHPGLRAAQANRARAELERQRASRETRPDLTLGFAAGSNGATDEDVMEMRASLPLPLLNRAQGRRREARALAEIAGFELAATEQRLRQEFDAKAAQMDTAGAQTESYRARILPKATEAQRLVRGGFEAGTFAFLDVVDTQRTVAESQLEYLDKVLELNIAMAELEALAGIELGE